MSTSMPKDSCAADYAQFALRPSQTSYPPRHHTYTLNPKPKPLYHIYLNPNGIYREMVNRVNRFIAKWSIDLSRNGQSSQSIYREMVNRVNRFIAKWSIESIDLSRNGQSIYREMVNRVNRFIAKWSIESIDLSRNGQSSQSIYREMVNPFIAKWSIESIDLLRNGQSSQSIYREMVNPFIAKWSIESRLGFRVQGLEMVRGQSIYCLPMVNPFIANGQSGQG